MNRFNAALVLRWVLSLLWHMLNIIIWGIYEATKPDDAVDNREHKFKDRNHLWVLHGLYFTCFILAFLSLIFVQTSNINLIENENKNQSEKNDFEQSNKQLDSMEVETQTCGQRFFYNAQYLWKQLKRDILSLNK